MLSSRLVAPPAFAAALVPPPPAMTGCATPSFGAATNFAAGTNPLSVTTGDFNGDGKPDLATANRSSDNVSVLLGNGMGGFAAAVNFAAGTAPQSVTTGDFNGDGKLDLATANSNSDNVLVLLNNCTANTPPTITPIGITRTAGVAASNSQIATANDAQDALNTLQLQISSDGGMTFSNSATLSGVTVTLTDSNAGASGINPNAMGQVFADVAAACAATNATFKLRVTDSGVLTDTKDFTVTVTAQTLPTISINDVTLAEGNAGATAFNFTVSLNTASLCNTITVNYATANGTATTADSDYALSSGILSFAPGETMKTVTVNVTGDTKFETNETFFVNLTSPTNATIADAQGLGTINNDDAQPTIAINDVAVTEGNAATVNASFTVSLSAVSGVTTTVQYATANGTASAGSDYVAVPLTTLTFSPGEQTKTVTVLVNGDTTVEPDETFFVNLSNPTNATIADNQGQGTITNDDLPPFTSSLSDPFVCNGIGSSIQVTVQLTNPNAAPAPATFNVNLPVQLTIIPNSCTANVGTCTTTTPNLVTWSGTLAAGQTVTIQYQAQVADGTPLGTVITINSNATLNGAVISAAASGTVSCPGNIIEVSDQKPGSLLVFPYYKHDARNKVDTRLTITNIGKLPINVHFLFLDGATCQEFDQFVCFTPNASITWKASEFDPQNKGYVIAYTVDNMGRPIAYNGLIGNGFVNDGEYVGNYGAESFASSQTLGSIIGAVDTPGQSWTLPFDGVALDMVPMTFVVDIQSPVDNVNQKLVLAGLRGDAYAGKLSGVSQVGTGLAYNGHEALRSFSPFISGQCFIEKIIDGVNPKVTGTLAGLIPKSEVGTLRFNVTAAVGLLMTSNKNTFAGIRTLHKVQVVKSTIIIPLLMPDCQYWIPQP